MKRLYFRLYGAFLLIVVLAAGIALLTARLVRQEQNDVPRHLTAFCEVIGEAIPNGAGAQDALVGWAERLSVHLGLFDEDGAVLARSDSGVDSPGASLGSRWMHTDVGWGTVAPLRDGRVMVAVPKDGEPGKRARKFVIALLAVLGAVGLGCYPLARALTRRLEGLERGVAQFGTGDLTVRIAVKGKDEIARVAERFNEAAERIERLVAAERRVIASASHELRSPLARIRLAIELARTRHPDAVLDGAVGDIAELDSLVEDMLLGARLGARGADRGAEPVDLTALVAETVGIVRGGPVLLRVDERAVRRAIRNLVDNARQHGGGEPEAEVENTADGTVIRILDRGPGVPSKDVNALFEPFARRTGSEGVGLGLSLVREIAEAHGGRATHEPREGGGSVFAIHLGRPKVSS